MSWQEIKDIHTDIVGFYVPQHKKNKNTAIKSVDDIQKAWHRFCLLINRNKGTFEPFTQLHTVLESTAHDKSQSKIKILDHGCNQGFSLFYLLALGFYEVYGIDLPETHCGQLNEFTRSILKLKRQVFFEFDGETLPFKDSEFDIIISQQVLEHVEARLLNPYLSEGFRVLRHGGSGYYEMPVKSILYDSHLQIWLLHMMPRPFWLMCIHLLRGEDRMNWAKRTLFLRHRSTILKIFNAHCNNVNNVTTQRLISSKSAEHYIGSASKRKLRIILSKLINQPVIGRILANIVSPFVVQTFIVKK